MMSGSLLTRIPSKSKMMARSKTFGLSKCWIQASGFRLSLDPEFRLMLTLRAVVMIHLIRRKRQPTESTDLVQFPIGSDEGQALRID